MRESLNYSPVSGKKEGLDKRDNSMEQLTRRNDIIQDSCDNQKTIGT